MSEQQHLSPANAMVLLQRDDGRILAVREVVVMGGRSRPMMITG